MSGFCGDSRWDDGSDGGRGLERRLIKAGFEQYTLRTESKDRYHQLNCDG